ncbi:nucleotidyl transferase AbiEii/AbiGii toxin family protein [Helcococcus kunzii]|uniref:nucleotidyl transferase AbiEii/AbiGii toxin family protein n=1 Tax=Helcococcus kunzii TaxID=40091 RepID=UPI0038ACFA71
MNKDSITARLRNKAKELYINYNLALTQFFFDEFLRLLSQSKYKNNFMIKGGMLLTYTLGVQNRTTQDIDFLVKGINLNSNNIKSILLSIVSDSKQSNVWFEIEGEGEKIRSDDEYGGLRFKLIDYLSNIRIPFAIDIATGDPVYPSPVEEKYQTILGDRYNLKFYPIESVLSEKFHTILARAENNSRSKDFYDLYTIFNKKKEEIDFESLKTAVSLTFRYRQTIISKERAIEIINFIKINEAIRDRWNRYQKKNPYTKEIDFDLIIDTINKLIEDVM